MNKKIIAINSGSSSLKFQLFEMPEEKIAVKGLFERISLAEEVDFTCQIGLEKVTYKLPLKSHQDVVSYLLEFLIEKGIVNNLDEIAGVGHRVAHGGEYFKKSSIINEKEQKMIEELSPLAPLHNPVNLVGIEAFRKVLPDCPQVGVFDTSFHQTMSKKDYLYALPYEYYSEDKIRRYGFHGTSHQFVANQVAQKLDIPITKLSAIVCHIGNGASVCGVKNGESKLTSMGFTPLAGLMMGTRCGDIDPSVVTYIQENKNLNSKEVLKIMNEKSGLLGVSQLSNDTRDVIQAAESGNEQAKLAIEMYASKIKQTIGAYLAELGEIDALVFTAGVGENSSLIRKMVCSNLEHLGISIDVAANEENNLLISSKNSKTKIMIVETNEELMIVKDTYQLIV